MKKALCLLLVFQILLGVVGCAVPSEPVDSTGSGDTSAADIVSGELTGTDILSDITTASPDITPTAPITTVPSSGDTTEAPKTTTEAPKTTTAAPTTTAKPADNVPVPTGYNVISIQDYMDKTTAGFVAQLVGFFSGYEFARDSDGKTPRVAMPDDWFKMCEGPYAVRNSKNVHESKLIYNEENKLWECWNDDDYSIDILNQYILSDMYSTYGTFSTKIITDGWAKYDVWDMGGGHRTFGAYGLMKNKRYLTPFSGNMEYGNLYCYCGEPYIANETLGMNTAGMPNVAIDMAQIFGSVTGDQDNILWLKFFAAMYSMAYFESDIVTLVKSAQKILPEDCWPSQIIDEVFALKEKYPTDWRRAVVNAERNCYRHYYKETDPMGETGINCSFIMIGLIYGNGDYYETCKIISLAGHGGDSTTPVALSIVGIIDGMKNLPEIANERIWQDGKGVIINLPRATKSAYYMYCAGLPERIKITDIIEMYRKNFEKILLENGGKIEDGKYYIPKAALVLKVPDTVVIKNSDFETGTLEGFSANGTGTTISKTAFTGNYSAQVNGGGDGNNSVYTTVSGLKKGSLYKMTAFVYSTANSTAQLFARVPGAQEYQNATVYDQTDFVKREFVFTATAEKMELGLLFKEQNEYKYAMIDDITIVRIEETKVGATAKITSASVSGETNKYTGVINVKVSGKADKEVYLKVSFANLAKKILPAAILVNGESFNTAVFYKTGTSIAAGATDFMYIPVLLKGNETSVTLDIKTELVYIKSIEVVTVSDRVDTAR